MHLQRHNQTIDLEAQLSLQSQVIKQLRYQFITQREQFISQLNNFRDTSEKKLQNLQVFYIEELMRVFDFSEVEDIKQHVIELVKRSKDSALRIKDLRQVHESNMKLCQQTQNEVNDLKRQIEQLNETINNKQMIIDELNLVNDKNSSKMMFSDDEQYNQVSLNGSTQQLSRMNSQASLEESSYGKMVQRVKSNNIHNITQSKNYRRFKPLQDGKSNLQSQSNIPINLSTIMVGDELDYKQVKITILEDLEQYKMTRNPMNSDQYPQSLANNCLVSSANMNILDKSKNLLSIKQFASTLITQGNNSISFNEQQYISIVMPWIVDVEASKQLIMKKHADLLEKYNQIISQLNTQISQNNQFKGQISVLNITLSQQSHKYQRKIDDYIQCVQDIQQQLQISNKSRLESEQSMVNEQNRRYQIETELYHQTLQNENLNQQILQFKTKIQEISEKQQQTIKEQEISKLNLKIQYQSEVHFILENQLKAVSQRMKELEYQNTELYQELQHYKQDKQENNESLQTTQVQVDRCLFLENQLNLVNLKLNEQVEFLIQRNMQYDVAQKQSDEFSLKLNQYKADNQHLKRKLVDISSQMQNLVEEKQHQASILQQFIFKFKSQLESKNQEVKQLQSKLKDRSSHKPTQDSSIYQIPKAQYKNHSQKDCLNRVISVQKLSENSFSESFCSDTTFDLEPSSQSLIDEIYTQLDIDSNKQSTQITTANSLLYLNNEVEIHLENQYVQTNSDNLTIQTVSCNTQVEISYDSEAIQTMIQIDSDDPFIQQKQKEILFLTQQVQIYEKASIMQETKNNMLTQSYSQFQVKLQHNQEVICMQHEEIIVREMMFLRLMEVYKQHKCPTKDHFLADFQQTYAQEKGYLQVQLLKSQDQYSVVYRQVQEQREIIKNGTFEQQGYCEKIVQLGQVISLFDVKISHYLKNLVRKVGNLDRLIARLQIPKDKLSQGFNILSEILDQCDKFGNNLDITELKKSIINSDTIECNKDQLIKLVDMIRQNSLQSPSVEKQLFPQEIITCCQVLQTEDILQSDFSTQIDIDIEELILQSEIYLKAAKQIFEFQQSSEFQETQIQFLRQEVKDIKKDYETQIKQMRLLHAGRPPREEDVAVIHQQKVLLDKQKNQISDLNLRYNQLARQFQISDGLVEMMVGGRSNSTQQVRQNKWNINGPSPCSLKRFL